MLQNQLLVTPICNYEKVLGRHQMGETLIGRADKRFARIADIKELLRLALTTLWPEASAYASRHNYAINRSFSTHINNRFHRIVQR